MRRSLLRYILFVRELFHWSDHQNVSLIILYLLLHVGLNFYYLCCTYSSVFKHGRRNRSGRLGDRRTNVCSLVFERLADAISEVINFKNFPRFARIVDSLEHGCLEPLSGNTWRILCKANGATLHYVLASFVLSTLLDLSKVPFIAGKAVC